MEKTNSTSIKQIIRDLQNAESLAAGQLTLESGAGVSAMERGKRYRNSSMAAAERARRSIAEWVRIKKPSPEQYGLEGLEAAHFYAACAEYEHNLLDELEADD